MSSSGGWGECLFVPQRRLALHGQPDNRWRPPARFPLRHLKIRVERLKSRPRECSFARCAGRSGSAAFAVTVTGRSVSDSEVLAPHAGPECECPSRDDRALVDALRDGDEGAFRELFRRKYGLMKRIARGFVASDAVAEEIVQETWLAVVNGVDRFESRSSLDTWISSILVNQARKHGVRERRSTPFCCLGSRAGDGPSVDPDQFEKEGDAWPGHWATGPRPWHSPERRLLSLEAREHLKHALGQLPERQRLVVGLRDVEGHSAEEVCSLLDLSEENQRVLLHRGRSRLRASLDRYLAEEAA